MVVLYFKLFRFISVFAFICVCVISSMSVILPAWSRSRAEPDRLEDPQSKNFIFTVSLQRCLWLQNVPSTEGFPGLLGLFSDYWTMEWLGDSSGPSRLVISHCFGLVSLLQIKWKNFKNFLRLI